jgi:hypothetical protein
MVKLKFLPMNSALIATSLAFAILAGCSSSSTSVPRAGVMPGSFAQLGDDAFATVTSPVWNAGNRRWNYCANFSSCGGSTNDWGADSMINIMYERWLVTRDPSIATSLLGFDAVHRFVDTTRTPRALAGSDVFMYSYFRKRHNSWPMRRLQANFHQLKDHDIREQVSRAKLHKPCEACICLELKAALARLTASPARRR